MIIGLAGPCNPRALVHHLDPADAARAPAGGRGVPLELLADSLIGLGHKVIIYTLEMDCAEPMRLAGPQLVIRIGPYRARHRMRDLFAVERRYLEEAMRAEPPQIMHVHWGYENALAALDADVAPVLLTLHDWAPAILAWQVSAYRLGRLLMYVMALRRTRWLSAPSPYLTTRVRRWFKRHCSLVVAGLDPATLAAAPRSIPGGPPVLVAANQGFNRFKNVTALLRAFPLVRAAFPQARLRLLGYDYEAGGVAETWAARRNLLQGVEFIGQVSPDDVLAEFAAAHVMVHPSQVESFGHVLIEAMSQGTPVVAAAEAEAPSWVLGHGAHGVLARCRSPEAIAQACISLLSDPARWEEVGRAGKEAVASHYSMTRVTAQYLALYDSILAA